MALHPSTILEYGIEHPAKRQLAVVWVAAACTVVQFLFYLLMVFQICDWRSCKHVDLLIDTLLQLLPTAFTFPSIGLGIYAFRQNLQAKHTVNPRMGTATSGPRLANTSRAAAGPINGGAQGSR